MDTRQAAPYGRQLVCHGSSPSDVSIEMQDSSKALSEAADVERQRLRQRLLRLILKNESLRVARPQRPPQRKDS
jgi:hypothetical protein